MKKVIPAVACALIACGSEPSDLSRCYQTYEFGNTGCAELTGLVTNPQGLPVDGAFVGVRGPAESEHPASFGSGYGQTGSAGRYRFRVIRYAGESPTVGPDTLTVWMWAAVPPAPGAPIGVAGPTDSVRATLEFRPIGELPVVAEVATIAVPIP